MFDTLIEKKCLLYVHFYESYQIRLDIPYIIVLFS